MVVEREVEEDGRRNVKTKTKMARFREYGSFQDGRVRRVLKCKFGRELAGEPRRRFERTPRRAAISATAHSDLGRPPPLVLSSRRTCPRNRAPRSLAPTSVLAALYLSLSRHRHPSAPATVVRRDAPPAAVAGPSE